MKRSPLTRGGKPLRVNGLLRKFGKTADEWKKFRNAKFERDKDDEGLIRCQDVQLGLPRCGIARSEMDLHHIFGRSGKLLFDESKMVWLTRECHQKEHARVQYEE